MLLCPLSSTFDPFLRFDMPDIFRPAALMRPPASCFTTQGIVCRCGFAHPSGQPKHHEGIIIEWVRWIVPEPNWYKLNPDGAAKGYRCPGRAGAGGLIRDSYGRWVSGFSHNIGMATAIDAELCAITIGLELAWNIGIRCLILEVDSGDAIHMVTNPQNTPETPVLDLIWSFLDRNWTVRIQHVYREGNSSADWLANHSLQFESGTLVELIHPPPEMGHVLLSDLMGTYTPRLPRKWRFQQTFMRSVAFFVQLVMYPQYRIQL